MTGPRVRGRLWSVLLVGARRPRLTLLGTLVIMAVSIALVLRLRPDPSVGSLLGRSDPAARAMADILDRFAPGEDLVVLAYFEEGVGPGAPADRATELSAYAERLADRLGSGGDSEAGELVRSVIFAPSEQMTEYASREVLPAAAYFLSDADLEALIQRLDRREMDEQLAQDEAMLAAPGPGAGALAETLLRDPLRLREFLAPRLAALAPPMRLYAGGDGFISTDARGILIRVAGTRSATDLDHARRLTELVGRAVDDAAPGAITVQLTGTAPIAALSARAVRADTTSSIVWSLVLMGALFLVMYRSPLAFPLAIAPVAVGVLGAFAVHSLFSTSLTPLTAVIGAMLAGLGSDYGVHVMSHVEHDRAAGADTRSAAERSIRTLAPSLLVACLTSIAGFVALLASSIPALRDFAGVGCLGLLLVLGVTLIALPASLCALPSRPTGSRLVGARFSFTRVGVFTWTHRRACIAVALCVGVTAGCVALAPGKFSWVADDLRVMHPAPNPALDTQDRVAKLFGVSPGTLLVHLSAGDDEELVTLAHGAATALRSERSLGAGVSGDVGLHSFVPAPARVREVRERLAKIDISRVEREFRAAVGASAFEPSGFEAYVSFLHRLLGEAPPPTLATLRRYPDVAAMVLPRTWHEGAGREALTTVFFSRELDRRGVRKAAIRDLREALSGSPGAVLTGLPVLADDAEAAIGRDLPRVLAVGLVIVVVLLYVHFRSVTDTALALLPFVFGIICTLAWMRASGTPFNMVNQMALPILCGLGVDFGIFLIGVTRHARDEGADTEGTVRQLGASLHALFMSTAPNILAVGALSATSVPAIQSLGNGLAVGLIGAWFGAQLIVAPLAVARSARRRA